MISNHHLKGLCSFDLIIILFFSLYVAQSSTASDDDLLHITHTGSVHEQTEPVRHEDNVHTAVDDIPGMGQYDDFHTIDWQRDIARDRTRHRYNELFSVVLRIHSIWFLNVFPEKHFFCIN